MNDKLIFGGVIVLALIVLLIWYFPDVKNNAEVSIREEEEFYDLQEEVYTESVCEDFVVYDPIEEEVSNDLWEVDDEEDSVTEFDYNAGDVGDIDSEEFLVGIYDYLARQKSATAIEDAVAELSEVPDVLETEETEEIEETKEDTETEEIMKEQTQAPVRSRDLIIDTDFASDADDVLAIRLAFCYQDLGLLNVKGISLSTSYSRSPLAVHALCKQDGYGLTPVAMDTSGNGVQVHTEYVNVMYESPKSLDTYEQPVEMYRRLLASSENKVNIITLGFLQNIQNLLSSKPDKYSPLTGAELVMEKVDTLYIVGGSDNKRPSFNFYWTGDKVIKAAQVVSKAAPCRVVYLPTDLSSDTFCGQFYQQEDRKKADLVTKALTANKQDKGVVAWDVFSLWCAYQDIDDNLKQYGLNLEQGNWYVSQTGATEWVEDISNLRYRITKDYEGGFYNTYLNGMLKDKYNRTHDK